MMADLPTYMTVTEFAKLYRMHPYTVQRMCREGRLDAVQIGNRWKIRGIKK